MDITKSAHKGDVTTFLGGLVTKIYGDIYLTQENIGDYLIGVGAMIPTIKLGTGISDTIENVTINELSITTDDIFLDKDATQLNESKATFASGTIEVGQLGLIQSILHNVSQDELRQAMDLRIRAILDRINSAMNEKLVTQLKLGNTVGTSGALTLARMDDLITQAKANKTKPAAFLMSTDNYNTFLNLIQVESQYVTDNILKTGEVPVYRGVPVKEFSQTELVDSVNVYLCVKKGLHFVVREFMTLRLNWTKLPGSLVKSVEIYGRMGYGSFLPGKAVLRAEIS